MALVTFENVATAVEKIVAVGGRPSVRAVIAELGGGSPNSVLKLLAEYKAGRPVVRVADTELDQAITSAIKVQMQRVGEAAATAAEQRAADADDSLAVISESLTLAEQQIEGLMADVAKAKTQASDFADQIKEAAAEAERSAALHARELAEVRQELSIERARADRATSDLARAEVRLEALPALHAEIEKLRVALGEQTHARVNAEQNAAVFAAKLEAAERFGLEARELAKMASDRAENMAVQVAQVVQELNTTKVQIQAQQSALDTSTREIASLKTAAREAQSDAKKAGDESAQLRGQLEATKQAFLDAKSAAETAKT